MISSSNLTIEGMALQMKYVCFTVFDGDEGEDLVPEYTDKMSYLVWQYEVCPDTGRRHKQGYAEAKTKNGLTIPGWQRELACGSIHIERRRGTSDQAASYCMKEETRMEGTEPVEHGVRSVSKQGRRSDLDGFRESVKRGKTDKALFTSHLDVMLRYPNAADRIRTAFKVKDKSVKPLPQGYKKQGVWLWSSAANMGKTSWVLNEFPDDVYEKTGNRWWSNYGDERVILIDDPPKVWAGALAGYIKVWCQEKPFKAQTGVGQGEKSIRPQKFFITCNEHPSNYFGDTYHESAFLARFDIIQVTDPLFTDTGHRAGAGLPDDWKPLLDIEESESESEAD